MTRPRYNAPPADYSVLKVTTGSGWLTAGRGRVGGAAIMERRAVEGELSRFWEAKKPHLINEMITFLIQMT